MLIQLCTYISVYACICIYIKAEFFFYAKMIATDKEEVFLELKYLA